MPQHRVNPSMVSSPDSAREHNQKFLDQDMHVLNFMSDKKSCQNFADGHSDEKTSREHAGILPANDSQVRSTSPNQVQLLQVKDSKAK